MLLMNEDISKTHLTSTKTWQFFFCKNSAKQGAIAKDNDTLRGQSVETLSTVLFMYASSQRWPSVGTQYIHCLQKLVNQCSTQLDIYCQCMSAYLHSWDDIIHKI